MCDLCKTIFTNREQHETLQCPLRESFYCSLCQVYGHHTNVCPDKDAWTTRVPEFQEQLIPLHIRNLYNITTATPLCGTPSPSPEIYTPAFEIVDSTPKSIRAALTALGVQGKSDLENKRTLERLVHAQGKKLVYLQDEQVKAAAKPKKEKRKIKASKAARTGLCDERAVPPSDIA